MTSIHDGLVVVGRAEIDSRPPFKSVKEAVMLFGEKVLGGEIYANKLKEIRAVVGGETAQGGRSKIKALTEEVEETKKSLEKAREENKLMGYRIKSLREELEHTKKELHWVEANKKRPTNILDPELEDLNFIEKQTTFDADHETHYIQKKRSVKFASPPSEEMLLEKAAASSVKKPVVGPSKRPLVPLLGRLFSKKKENQHTNIHPPVEYY